MKIAITGASGFVGVNLKSYLDKDYIVDSSSASLCSIVIYLEQGLVDLVIAIGTLSIVHFFPKMKSKVGLFLGTISYSLYLLHSIIGAPFINFMSHYYTSPEGKLLTILIATGISIASAYFFWRLIERPSQLKSQKIKLQKVDKTKLK